MHAVVTGRCPAYLESIVQPATQSRSGLRLSSFDFSVPRTRTKFGERAFSYAGPSAWNTLPRHIREIVDSASFKKLLKRIILLPPSASSDFYNSYCFISD